MSKEKKKEKKRAKDVEDVSHDSDSSGSRPYVEVLKEKFMAHHDPSIMLKPEERLSIEWRNITYAVPIVKRTCCKVTEKKDKVILKDVSGLVPAGSLLVRTVHYLFAYPLLLCASRCWAGRLFPFSSAFLQIRCHPSVCFFSPISCYRD